MPTVALVGFLDGKLRELADHVIWVTIENYGIVEDTRRSLIRVLTRFLRSRSERSATD